MTIDEQLAALGLLRSELHYFTRLYGLMEKHHAVEWWDKRAPRASIPGTDNITGDWVENSLTRKGLLRLLPCHYAPTALGWVLKDAVEELLRATEALAQEPAYEYRR